MLMLRTFSASCSSIRIQLQLAITRIDKPSSTRALRLPWKGEELSCFGIRSPSKPPLRFAVRMVFMLDSNSREPGLCRRGKGEHSRHRLQAKTPASSLKYSTFSRGICSTESAAFSYVFDRDGLTVISYLKGRDKLHVCDVRRDSPVGAGIALPSPGGSALYARISLTPDGIRGFLSRGTDIASACWVTPAFDVSRAEAIHEIKSRAVSNAISSDGRTAIVAGKGSAAMVFSMDTPCSNVLSHVDIGPLPSLVPLGSEIRGLHSNCIMESEFPSLEQLTEAVDHVTPGITVKTMADIYCAHLLMRTMQDWGVFIRRYFVSRREVSFDFMGRNVYLKLSNETGREDGRKEIAQKTL